MRIETICENRKELVKAMAEILGEPSKYLDHQVLDTR